MLIKLPDKKYNIIYADPPWAYKKWAIKKDSANGLACQHYDVMKKEDIENLDIQRISEKDCSLFLWATYPCIEQALELIKAWGFTYKTIAFTWIKKNKKSDSLFWGMGSYTRANAELCLLGTRGKIKVINRGIHSVIESPIQEHSRKPQEAMNRIIKLLGEKPRIELFSRRETEGWDSWGIESNK